MDDDTLDYLSSVFGFKYHEGADRYLEANVIKLVLSRETILSKLIHLCQGAISANSALGSKVLDLLMKIRQATVLVLDAVFEWRNSISDDSPDLPTPFFWEGRNYVLKIVDDLNFLADNIEFAQALGLKPEKLRRNPLMLSNTLEEANLLVDPFQQAGLDTGGKYYGTHFEERQRLRGAERVLVVELQCAHFPGRCIAGIKIKTNKEKSPQKAKKKRKEKDQPRSPLEDHRPSRKGLLARLQDEFSKTTSVSADSLIDATVAHNVFPESYEENFENGDVEDAKDSFPVVSSTLRYSSPRDAQTLEPVIRRLPSGGGSSFRREVSSRWSAVPSLTMYDLDLCSEVSQPSNRLQLAGAICLILLADGFNIPDDMSWQTFQGLASNESLAELLNKLKPDKIPRFKVTAMKPYMTRMKDEEYNENTFPVEKSTFDETLSFETRSAIDKLCNWVGTLLEESEALMRIDSTLPALPSPIQTNTTRLRRLKSASEIERREAEMQLERDRNEGKMTSTKNTSNMAVIPKVSLVSYPFHTVVIDGPDSNPLVVTLLSTIKSETLMQRRYDTLFLISNADPERLMVKAFDPASSREGGTSVLMREFVLFYSELMERYPDAGDHFQPGSVNWWMENIASIVVVRNRKKDNSQLAVHVSKRSIERLIRDRLGMERGNSVDWEGEESTFEGTPETSPVSLGLDRALEFFAPIATPGDAESMEEVPRVVPPAAVMREQEIKAKEPAKGTNEGINKKENQSVRKNLNAAKAAASSSTSRAPGKKPAEVVDKAPPEHAMSSQHAKSINAPAAPKDPATKKVPPKVAPKVTPKVAPKVAPKVPKVAAKVVPKTQTSVPTPSAQFSAMSSTESGPTEVVPSVQKANGPLVGLIESVPAKPNVSEQMFINAAESKKDNVSLAPISAAAASATAADAASVDGSEYYLSDDGKPAVFEETSVVSQRSQTKHRTDGPAADDTSESEASMMAALSAVLQHASTKGISSLKSQDAADPNLTKTVSPPATIEKKEGTKEKTPPRRNLDEDSSEYRLDFDESNPYIDEVTGMKLVDSDEDQSVKALLSVAPPANSVVPLSDIATGEEYDFDMDEFAHELNQFDKIPEPVAKASEKPTTAASDGYEYEFDNNDDFKDDFEDDVAKPVPSTAAPEIPKTAASDRYEDEFESNDDFEKDGAPDGGPTVAPSSSTSEFAPLQALKPNEEAEAAEEDYYLDDMEDAVAVEPEKPKLADNQLVNDSLQTEPGMPIVAGGKVDGVDEEDAGYDDEDFEISRPSTQHVASALAKEKEEETMTVPQEKFIVPRAIIPAAVEDKLHESSSAVESTGGQLISPRASGEKKSNDISQVLTEVLNTKAPISVEAVTDQHSKASSAPTPREPQPVLTAEESEINQQDLPPLPANWAEYHTESGHPYYYNDVTHESRWDRPTPDEYAEWGEAAHGNAEQSHYQDPGHIENEGLECSVERDGGAGADYGYPDQTNHQEYPEAAYHQDYIDNYHPTEEAADRNYDGQYENNGEYPAAGEHLNSQLPEGWTQYQTDSGRAYYHNEHTNESTWEWPGATSWEYHYDDGHNHAATVNDDNINNNNGNNYNASEEAVKREDSGQSLFSGLSDHPNGGTGAAMEEFSVGEPGLLSGSASIGSMGYAVGK